LKPQTEVVNTADSGMKNYCRLAVAITKPAKEVPDKSKPPAPGAPRCHHRENSGLNTSAPPFMSSRNAMVA